MIMNDTTLTLKLERAISELRRGGKVVISDPNFGTSVLLVAAELINEESVNNLSDLALSRPNVILSENRSNAIGIKIVNKPCSILIDKSWTVHDILSLCMPLTGHKIPYINGVIEESNKKIVAHCLLILRQSRLLPAGLMSIISNIQPENISQWAFKNNFIFFLCILYNVQFARNSQFFSPISIQYLAASLDLFISASEILNSSSMIKW